MLNGGVIASAIDILEGIAQESDPDAWKVHEKISDIGLSQHEYSSAV